MNDLSFGVVPTPDAREGRAPAEKPQNWQSLPAPPGRRMPRSEHNYWPDKVLSHAAKKENKNGQIKVYKLKTLKVCIWPNIFLYFLIAHKTYENKRKKLTGFTAKIH